MTLSDVRLRIRAAGSRIGRRVGGTTQRPRSTHDRSVRGNACGIWRQAVAAKRKPHAPAKSKKKKSSAIPFHLLRFSYQWQSSFAPPLALPLG
jgi:hypothetical protein